MNEFVFDELMEEAKILESHLCTDWAEENESRYDAFQEAVETAYDNEEINIRQFSELVSIAFYDYTGYPTIGDLEE